MRSHAGSSRIEVDLDESRTAEPDDRIDSDGPASAGLDPNPPPPVNCSTPMHCRMNDQSQSTPKRKTAISTTVTSTTVVARYQIFLAGPRDLVHLGFGGDQELGERREMDDPEDHPAQDTAKAAGIPNRASARCISIDGLVDPPDPGRGDHSQANRRVEPGIPSLHGLVEVGPDQVDEEGGEGPWGTARLPLGGLR